MTKVDEKAVAWQWLCKSTLGYPSRWVNCDDAEDAASKSVHGTEVRPLYLAKSSTPEPAGDVREVLDLNLAARRMQRQHRATGSEEEIEATLAAALSAPAPAKAAPRSGGAWGRVAIAHDGFAGDIIGHYQTREGKRGVVVQQDGTRVVHVYGEKWLTPPAPPQQGETT